MNLNDYEGSLFASLFWMVGVFCAPIGGFISGWLGRKKIVIIAAPMVACGWLIIGLAQNKIMLYVGRIVTAGRNPFFLKFLTTRARSNPTSDLVGIELVIKQNFSVCSQRVPNRIS